MAWACVAGDLRWVGAEATPAMSRILSLATALLAFAPALADAETLHRSGNASNRHDLVILADGFRANERDKFDREARDVLEAMRTTEPFASLMGRINVHSHFRASARSGPSTTNNAYGTHFTKSGFSFDTHLAAQNRLLIMADAAATAGQVDSILVILNSSRRGGTATGFLCFASTGGGPRVALHELGHAIGRLGDEYSTGDIGISRDVVALIYPNLTTARTRDQLPWKQFVSPDTRVPASLFTRGVSAYQGGGTYASGLYRPERNCRMRTDGPGFCVVCRHELTRRIQNTSTGSSGGSTTGTGSGTSGTPGQVVGVTSRLRVRGQPTTASSILGYLQPGAAVRVLGPAEAGFYPIAFNGGRGYVGRNFIRLGTASAGINASVQGLAR